MFNQLHFRIILLCLFVAAQTVYIHGAKNDWAEGNEGRNDGATRDYYNRGGYLPWDNYMGDWSDAADVPQGSIPFSTANIIDNDTSRYIEWDVTGLCQAWVDGLCQNQGMLLRWVTGAGPFNFRSKEHSDPNEHPELVITIAAGTDTYPPEADTYLDSSTYQSLGHTDRLRVGTTSPTLLRFDLSAIAPGTAITQATLRLFTYAPQYGGSSMDIGVFRCHQGHDLPYTDPNPGLAANYPQDRGIENDPDVIFSTGFESPTWQDEWTYVGGVVDTVDTDPPRLFEPLLGRALRAMIPQDSHTALNITYEFQDEIGQEPEEIYFRYYLRFGDDWDQTVSGGKLPGIAGTYGQGGWGGRRSDGTNGWSARGLYVLTIPDNNPLGGATPIGYYCYHADQATDYGDNWHWLDDYRGFPVTNTWYCIEQYCRMNTPGVNDGVLRAWVDGRPAFEKTDIRFRDVDTLKIEEIWLNIYHGGTDVSPYDQHAFIDNVVIARSYIGPMVEGTYTVLRADGKSDLPSAPDWTFQTFSLPFSDPDAVFDPTAFPALLFYQVEPGVNTISVNKAGAVLVIDAN
ncbi:DNRLRE domain-containing protein [Acidobacteriota bacterium]